MVQYIVLGIGIGILLSLVPLYLHVGGYRILKIWGYKEYQKMKRELKRRKK